jgi:uncharacterized protein (TIGR02246 family)
MFRLSKSAVAIAVLVVLSMGWVGFAQVRDTTKGKSLPPPAGTAASTKPAPESARKGAEPAKATPARRNDAAPAGTPSRAAADDSPEAAAIRQSADAFVKAYNAHDAKAVSELFALKAEFTDEEGNLIQGREAIEQDFSRMFEANPQSQVEIDCGSIRVLTPNIAIEEGVIRGQATPDSPGTVSTYVAVHVKVDGKWVIASVNDFEMESTELSPGDRLQELAWMVGDWIDESPESVVKSSCRWDDSGSYLLHEFQIQREGSLQANGSMRIGWDPLAQQIRSWTFDADSGYSEGLWSRTGDEWSVSSRGVNGSGQITAGTHVFQFVDDDTMTWRSYDRTVAGEPVDDVPEFVVKRQAPEPNE